MVIIQPHPFYCVPIGYTLKNLSCLFQVNTSYLSKNPALQRVWQIVDGRKILLTHILFTTHKGEFAPLYFCLITTRDILTIIILNKTPQPVIGARGELDWSDPTTSILGGTFYQDILR